MLGVFCARFPPRREASINYCSLVVLKVVMTVIMYTA